MDNRSIVVRGAREHNLRNVNLELPHGKLIVFTGVSGSGKSSLAFDTLYAEGQRRYVESLSNYARQFLGQLPKPDVDYIGGLAPAISIQQKSASRNPRSTVGTVTEVSDFLRVLFARVGQGHCPKCQRPITAQTREQIVGRILALPAATRFLVLAPVVRGQKGEFKDFFTEMVKRGYVRARVDGQIVRMTDDLRLDKKLKHNIEIVIDRLQVGERHEKSSEGTFRTRVAESVEQALTLGMGNIILSLETTRVGPEERKTATSVFEDTLLSAQYACTHCNTSYEPPSPQLFSFNSPQGMCQDCAGLGNQYTFDAKLLIPDEMVSFADGAITLIGPMKSLGRWRRHIFEGIAQSLGIDLKTPWAKLPEEQRNWILHGSGDRHIVWEWKQRGGKVWKHGGKWEGIVPQLLAQFRKATAGPRRVQLEKYMRVIKCPSCQGQRLNPQARCCRVAGKTLIEVGNQSIGELVPWLDSLDSHFSDVQRTIAGELLKEIRARLGFLLNVGLHYLSLDRSAPTLSGGEAQRIRLASQIGSGLVGVLYILDEPSIGLHPRDNDRLLKSLLQLRDMGNTVLVVEHDEDTMRAADYLVDFGPGPGVRGGQIVAAGPPGEVLQNPDSPTGQYLTGVKSIPIPKQRRKGTGQAIQVFGARQNNLRNVTVEFPLGRFLVVTGVSGSGKSSLINDVLRSALLKSTGQVLETEDEDANPDADSAVLDTMVYDRIEGAQWIDKVIDIDQSPIGRTPRSNPATYIKVWDEIRNLFAAMTDSKTRGYQPGRFSFNVKGGRCEACEGNGANKLEMDFLADVWVSCPVCDGKRFNQETLQVRYRGLSIYDVLEIEVAQALDHFANHPKIQSMLQTLHDVGLDYIKLGQPSSTLSGGEAQRIKLAKELCRKTTGKTIYILDEPTTGLHFEDIRKLLEVLHGFVDQGNTVLVIEHNLDVIKTADWIIDMGPEGGSGGGSILVQGTPEEVIQHPTSYTAAALKPILKPKARSISPSTTTASTKGKKGGRISNGNPAQEHRHIHIEGASQHNLKSVDADIPRNQMTVFCGPSGSGKSSLAMDTIYAEGQRRYVESLSSYARQFLGQVQKPRVEQLTGLSPAIAIEQKTTSKSPRSTVGTITEITDYLRVLYARLGQRYCPKCRIPIGTQTADEIIERILALPEGTKLYLMAPIERKGQEKFDSIFDEIRRAGFSRIRINRVSYRLDELPVIDHRRKHAIEVIVDRNVVRSGTRSRIAEAVEQALTFGQGVIHIALVDPDREESTWKVDRYSQHLSCTQCGIGYEQLNPHHYSFNSPLGWCPTCEGLGTQRGANEQLLLSDTSLTIRQGAIVAWPELNEGTAFLRFATSLALLVGFDLDTPFRELSPTHQRAILHGTGDAWIPLHSDPKSKGSKAKARLSVATSRFQYKGLFPAIDEASRVSFVYRSRLNHLVDEVPCTTCHGSRLRPDSASTRFRDLTLQQINQLSLGQSLALFQGIQFTPREQQMVGEVAKEVMNRLSFLVNVGLDYLSLDRTGPTLSGGEAQRIRLASQIGSGLTGVLYVLDEPTIGLHPRDNERLLKALHHLRDLGNTLILVEHDREVIQSADYLLDFGPGAGDRGGEITAQGTPQRVLKSPDSLTGKYLGSQLAIPVPKNRRIQSLSPSRATPEDHPIQLREKYSFPNAAFLSVHGARQHTLRNIDVHFPLSCLVAVTGVSGSGKSSLVNEVLSNTLARRLNRAQTPGAAHDDIVGIEHIDKIIEVGQDPLGNSPSSNPATYTGVFDLIRELFSRMPEAKVRGYPPRRFSFNQKGGRCEACEGNGQIKIEMHFLPDVWVDCESCHGQRYNAETLAVTYKGRSIADVLKLRISEALELFNNIPKIRIILQTLTDVGLGYMQLGQPAPTMSGGEAQRVKLAAELARPSTGKTLYLLDEPTTGLHFDDVSKLLVVLQRLADLGNMVLVVEHNLDIIKSADWVIDLGPEAGIHGGRVVAVGTPEDLVERGQTDLPYPCHTGRLLTSTLQAGPFIERAKYDIRSALAKRAGDLDLTEVGNDQKLPWELDGIKWHTQDRITTNGKPCKWDGATLSIVEAAIQGTGGFPETNWNHRSIVEISASGKADGWFLHAMTGHEAYLKLVFRVAKNSFKVADLSSQLNLKRLSDYPGFEGYSRDHRVEVVNSRGPIQEVIVTLVKVEEAQSPAFQSFLQEVIAAHRKLTEKMTSSIESLMPWKVNGESWHLGTKGFPPGKAAKWDRTLLRRLLDLLQEIEPKLEIKWDVRDAITLRVPESTRYWCRIKTKEIASLECSLVGEKAQFNVSRFEGLGRDPLIESDRHNGCDLLTLHFVNSDHFNTKKLKPLLMEHLAGFRRMRS